MDALDVGRERLDASTLAQRPQFANPVTVAVGQ